MDHGDGATAETRHHDGRRTDTRQRIQQVALEAFSEHGYDRTTLREIAERLQITRPAPYYHFKSKEDILASIHRDLALSLDDVTTTWARTQPATAATRAQILVKLSALPARIGDVAQGRWRAWAVRER